MHFSHLSLSSETFADSVYSPDIDMYHVSKMISSKSRTRSSEFERKIHKSALSRTLSFSRFCRGDPLISQIDKNALKPVEQNPLNRADLCEKQVVEITNMQQHVVQIEDELKNVKQNLKVTRDERDRALNELEDTKRLAMEASSKPNEVLPSPMMGEVLKMKEKEIKSLKLELKKAKGMETMIKIQELEDELERVKQSKGKMYERFVSQMKQLEETKIDLEESKLKVLSLRQDAEKSTPLHKENNGGTLEGAHNNESIDSEKNRIKEEINSLKGELKSAIEAEEKSNRAMEDLAIALKEVAAEANQAKKQLAFTLEELSHIKEESEQLKETARTIEIKYKTQLDGANIEIGRYNNTIERLRLEAEESLLAWSDKEMEFVSCIKKAEENNIRLVESLKEAEKLSKTSREENFKLRDIVKQALSEASVANEAARIAKIENSQLKNTQSGKDEALDNLAEENERLSKMLMDLKQLLSMPSQDEKVAIRKMKRGTKREKNLEQT